MCVTKFKYKLTISFIDTSTYWIPFRRQKSWSDENGFQVTPKAYDAQRAQQRVVEKSAQRTETGPPHFREVHRRQRHEFEND